MDPSSAKTLQAGRKLSYGKDKDNRIASHIREMVARGENVSIYYISKYAKMIIREECPGFMASTGWVRSFLLRHGIKLNSSSTNRGRPLSYPATTDREVADYVRSKLVEGRYMTNSEIRSYAKEVICKENPNFTGSASWVQNFLLRNKITPHSMSNTPLPSSGAGSSSSASPPASSPHVPVISSAATTSLVSPSLSDASLAPTETTPTPVPQNNGNTCTLSLDEVVDDLLKAAVAIHTSQNINMAGLTTAQTTAIETSISELTSAAFSLVHLLNETRDAGREGHVASVTSTLESPLSGDDSESPESAGVNSAVVNCAVINSVAETQADTDSPLPLVSHANHTPEDLSVDQNPMEGKVAKVKRSRLTYTLADKMEVVRLMEEYRVTPYHMCHILGIPSSTYNGWVKLLQEKGDQLQALSPAEKKAKILGPGQPLSYSSETDEQIARWVEIQQTIGITVTPASLARQATIAICQENPNFNASKAWQERFLRQHKIQLPGSATPPGNGEGVENQDVAQDKELSSLTDSDELERELAVWVRDRQAAQNTVSVQNLCKRAEELITKEIPSFVATLGWAFKFLHRNSIMLRPKILSRKQSNTSSLSSTDLQDCSSPPNKIRSSPPKKIRSSPPKKIRSSTPKKLRQPDPTVVIIIPE